MTVITSISLDHQAQLGETLEEIATEKAGIIKRSIPVVCGVGAGVASLSTDSAGQVAAQRKIHQIAANHESPVRQLGRDFHVRWNKRFHRNPTANDEVVEGTVLGGSIRYRSGAAPLDTAVNDSPIDGSLGSEWGLSMPGRHQADNAALAIATLQWMKELGWNFDEEKMRVGLCSARAKARIEVVSSDPWRIIDTAHNIASIDALLETLKEYFPEQRRIMIFAASRDKDFKQMLRAIRSHCDLLILTQYRENPRAVPLDLLQTSFVEVMREAPSTSTQPWDMPKPLMLSARDPEEAWEIGLQLSGPDDLLCATGSFFLAAELFPVIGSKRFAPSTEKKSSPPLSD